MAEGIILKGVGGFYTVLGPEGETYTCRPRGRFRKARTTPLPGDRVVFALPQAVQSEAWIDEILPRKNLLTRPAVANIDTLMIVLAASAPKPDLLLVDKLLIQCEAIGVRPVLLINKCDEADGGMYDVVRRDYANTGYPILNVSALSGEGMDALQSELSGRICCFAGQSAVGKSSLLNRLKPELALPTGEMSVKTERGRHTTRHAELWPAFGGAIVDTPGFSLLDLTELTPETLRELYPEMRPYNGRCRFALCLHRREPDCAVQEACGRGEIPAERYARYLLLLDELIQCKEHKYD